MVRHQRAAAAIVQEDPNVEGFMSAVGGGGSSRGTTNQGRLIIRLKDRSQRALSADQVYERSKDSVAFITARVTQAAAGPFG